MSVFVVLGLMWAAVLIPPVLRARAERRAEFIDSFRQQMGALGNKTLAGQVVADAHDAEAAARRPGRAVKRRRDILGGLLGAMIGAFVLGAVPSLRIVWGLGMFLLNLFIAYIALLAHQRNVARRQSVRAARVAFQGRRPLGKPAFAPVLNSRR
jgi:hypothetical protein